MNKKKKEKKGKIIIKADFMTTILFTSKQIVS